MDDAIAKTTELDLDQFRLRNFIDSQIGTDEVDVISDPRPLIDLARHMDGNHRAVLFSKAGPDGAEIVGNVIGSERLGAAFGTSRQALPRISLICPPICSTRATADPIFRRASITLSIPKPV
jgi:hypothetical protein